MNEKKTCKICGGEFALEYFAKSPKAKDGRTCVCKDCMRKLQSEGHKKHYADKKKNEDEEIQKARMMRLEEFTPRELMTALKRRGYEGKLTYVETHVIDFNTL